MDLNSLRTFARDSRNELLKSVSFKIDYVLSEDSHARRDNPKSISQLENKIKNFSKEEVIEEVSYTWFNRFIALQYMDINGFNDVKVISPVEGNTRPEILSNAISGVFDNKYISENSQNIISSLLEARSPSNHPENEAYKLLLVSVCNKFHSMMPFLFERIADYTELLIPDDLLSNKSIPTKVRNFLTKENCQNVEVIGWLYQFYISEKKDEIFADLKKNKKIISKNIPAATQLFTPSWIVKYLVQNSLGRLWMLNNPNSNLIHKMEYYISSEETENDFLKLSSPEEIKICDPACGSGHMLTYSFDLLYSIYQEEGYSEDIIPTLILKNNLYGIEIDKRAGHLSAFALSMKAREKYRNFFKNSIEPKICVLENIKFETNEFDAYINEVGRDLFTNNLQITLKQFEESDNFGSLIQPLLEDVERIREIIESNNFSSNLFLNSTHMRVLKVLEQVDYLSRNYHVVVANPPYMGAKGMNSSLSNFSKDNYPDSKSDLFAMFMERVLRLVPRHGYCALVTMQSWMFLSSYEKLRQKLLSNISLVSLAHMENMVMGIAFGTSATILNRGPNEKRLGAYCRIMYSDLNENKTLIDFPPANDFNKNSDSKNNIFWIANKNFRNIPGSPIAYWCSLEIQKIFRDGLRLESVAPTRKGMVTAQNSIYVRTWSEVSLDKTGLDKYDSRENSKRDGKKWFSYLKGGGFRKWYGNKFDLVNWENDGHLLQTQKHPKEDRVWATNFNLEYIFQPNVNWGAVTSSDFSARISKGGELFDAGGSACFPKEIDSRIILSYLNSKLVKSFLKILNPTLNFQAGNIANLPIILKFNYKKIIDNVDCLISISKEDWDSSTNSWDFKSLPILSENLKNLTIEKAYSALRLRWHELTNEMQRLEEKNNLIFIDAYKLQNELSPEVPLNEISLNNNPHFLYGKDLTNNDKENRMRQDTIKEFISYSVGCMFGRYSLDEPGLILANQGDNLKDYLKNIPKPSFFPDDDNVIPILELDWFEDDITARFKKFLKVTFSDQTFEENLRFIENSIGKDIRKYFINDFYKDHVQRYKKRPIYWMFSSPKGSFNALIYLHRYQQDTVSILLDKYLREFLLKLRAEKNTLERLEISSNSSSVEKTRATKNIQKIDSILIELKNWEKEVIFPLASQRLEIDLDDGVKINYSKFGTALKKISGLN